MATPFDATTKELVRLAPTDWLTLLGLPHSPCQLVDADLATVSTEADRLILVESPHPHIVHIEFQSGHDGSSVPDRALRYNALAAVQTGLSVLSFVVLLKSEADSPALIGVVEKRRPDYSTYLRFEYSVLRLWQIPVSRILRGGVTILPLALLCDLSETTPEAVVAAMDMRIHQQAQTDIVRKLWASAYLLAGLRFAPAIVGKLLEKAVAQMKESSTYQAILAEGRAEGRAEGEARAQRLTALAILRRLGEKRLGPPSDALQEVMEQASTEHLQEWLDHVTTVESWPELLAL